MAKKTEEATSRRDFLKLASSTAPVAIIAATAGAGAAQAADPDLMSDTLQDTAHTRAYYDSARF